MTKLDESQKPLVTDPDAMRWAKEFCEQFPSMNVDVMFGWFANAIMCGVDNERWRWGKKVKEALEQSEDVPKEFDTIFRQNIDDILA